MPRLRAPGGRLGGAAVLMLRLSPASFEPLEGWACHPAGTPVPASPPRGGTDPTLASALLGRVPPLLTQVAQAQALAL